MPIEILFWVVFLIWLVFGVLRLRAGGWQPIAETVLLCAVVALLGWKVFGSIVRD